ncbi:MAG: 1-deoxy-D-xylulose-5-phosphate reductoisomerase, partial [Betaproteobacteria bacterium]|nr:1-deoxy-D-xylulose-5-phosphate reductoisomerase [Betaproteobacteria bacterium]
DLAKAGRLDFEALDRKRFPCVTLAYDALKRGGTAPAVLNAANEIAVESFLNGQLAFTELDAVIEGVLSKAAFAEAATLDDVHLADAQARTLAKILISERMALRRLKG